MKEKFPKITYSIADGNVLSLETAKIGQIILHNENLGVITNIKSRNKYPINIALENNERLKVIPIAISKVDDESAINKIMNPQPEWQKADNLWYEGDCAYLVAKDQIIPVVYGGAKKTKYRFYIVSTQAQSHYYDLTQAQLRLVFDTKEEAELSLNSK